MSATPVGTAARLVLDRVHTLLPSEVDRREVRMFGAVAVMVDDAMVLAAHRDGSLLVRVDPAEDADLLVDPAAARAEMGAGRSMGEGWIHVDARGLCDDSALGAWVEAATRFWSSRRRPASS